PRSNVRPMYVRPLCALVLAGALSACGETSAPAGLPTTATPAITSAFGTPTPTPLTETPAAIEIAVTTLGRAVPDDYLGLSIEWPSVREYLGDGAGGVRAATATLLAAFGGEGHRVEIRIGGNSQDEAWWNPTGLQRPPDVNYDVGPVEFAT